jgi:GlpG protein
VRWSTDVSEPELYRTGLQDDLRPLSALLWQQRIRHRIAEEGGAQVLRLASTEDLERAGSLLDRWRSGELQVTLQPRERRARPDGPTRLPLSPALRQSPVTLTLIGLGVLGFLLVYLHAPVSWIALLSYTPFSLSEAGRPVFLPQDGQLWRLVTPVFLHFGWLHITFNALWCWELGKRIELVLGSLNLLGLFLVIAAVSNSAQQAVTGPALFGGLSGVVYGWLGFAWTAGRLNPAWRGLVPAPAIMLFMVGWLLICVVGLVNVLGFSVANAAHVGGLLSGAALGLVFGLVHRVRH